MLSTMHALLPRLFALPAPDDPVAHARGCSCPAARGQTAGVLAPCEPLGRRPFFAPPRETWFFYSTTCALHGRAAREQCERMDILDFADNDTTLDA